MRISPRASSAPIPVLTGRVNVSVLNQKLYYIKGEDIMEADMIKVFSVRVGMDIFVNVAGKLYKVLAESKGGAAVRALFLDTEQLNKASIGYGVSSSVAATQNVAGLAMDSNAGININQAIASKEGGKPSPPKREARKFPLRKRPISCSAGTGSYRP